MTDIDKALEILKSTNNDLPVHHRKIVEAALAGDLGEATGSKLIFEDLFKKLTTTTAEAQ